MPGTNTSGNRSARRGHPWRRRITITDPVVAMRLTQFAQVSEISADQAATNILGDFLLGFASNKKVKEAVEDEN